MPRIALIHAVAVAMAPVVAAFAERWPEAETVNLLDDSLSLDRAACAELGDDIRARIAALASYARSTGADGILYTCSAFGPAIDAVARVADVPVLKPNEAMFEQAIVNGGRIGMLATFGPSVGSMELEFRELAAARGRDAEIFTLLVPEALSALRQGDADRHDALLAAAVDRLPACSAIMLAHFSTSRARDAVSRVTRVPVLTGPDAAVEQLRARISAARGQG